MLENSPLPSFLPVPIKQVITRNSPKWFVSIKQFDFKYLVHVPEPEWRRQFRVVLMRCGASEKK